MTRNKIFSLFICAISAAILSHANAAVLHFNDYESSGANQGAGLGIEPDSMGFTAGGGDFDGLPGLGLSTANPSSGLYSYVIDGSQISNNGNGWGGNWSGIATNSSQATGGFFPDQAAAVAAGPGSQYVNVAAGATFTVSALVATDANDPATGGIVTQPRLEFHDAAGNELFRNDAMAPATATTLTTSYQSLTHSYTLTAADIAAGVVRVTAVIGTDGLGWDQALAADGGTDAPLAGGLVYYDDLSFTVDDAFIVTVPEPGTVGLILFGLLGVTGIARRRKN